ncbi:MAG TPA: MBL fold metallo-hydrolase [Methylomirabilota bacterium]|jgi:glyoxylase-like metal-dependent hydrolase (beta-lactamase superfamily II)|nr:MBL fold metallo-hydrolase [Methylomirabilota bacterium]
MESKIREVAAGIYQIYLPLPMRPSIVNVYLVRGGEEWALIDTGMSSEDSIATFKASLQQVGCPLSAVRKIICTHHHADHFGTSRPYKEMTGAEVYLNPLEIPRMERMQSSTPMPEALTFFRSHGIPLPESGDGLPAPGRYFGGLYAPTSPDHSLQDGDVVFIGSRELQVVWTPGHTAGHCCLYFPQEKVFIVGDHLLPKITPHVGVYYSGPDNPLQDFLHSQQKVQLLDVELVLPAHGAVFKDHRYRAQQIIQHHKYRLQEIQDAARGRARTARDIAEDIFDLGKEPSLFQLMAATFETLAHLHFLLYEGKVKRLEEGDKVKFVAA